MAKSRRGRKPGLMTHRRRQVFQEIVASMANGETVSLASLARRCGLYDYRQARRIMKDLEKMGIVN
ncbi:putative transcriptional regulator [Rhizorhapis suberifaciens]|uniref:Putative transcriptional regulator n=1 Tax=Rhizorhapis suberifaciens TaxID=13656 RepID=A0A840HXN1_9SPHN|nr:putative transcriptional regulator [Rhizorhapis suberifaciens]